MNRGTMAPRIIISYNEGLLYKAICAPRPSCNKHHGKCAGRCTLVILALNAHPSGVLVPALLFLPLTAPSPQTSAPWPAASFWEFALLNRESAVEHVLFVNRRGYRVALNIKQHAWAQHGRLVGVCRCESGGLACGINDHCRQRHQPTSNTSTSLTRLSSLPPPTSSAISFFPATVPRSPTNDRPRGMARAKSGRLESKRRQKLSSQTRKVNSSAFSNHHTHQKSPN